MRFHFLNRPRTGFVILLCLSALIAALVLEQFTHAKKSGEWVGHTYKVINRIDQLSNRITEAESSQRGFVLSGRGDLLHAYRTAVGAEAQQSESISNDLAQLQMLTKDNPDQRRHMQRLQRVVAQKIAYMAMVVTTAAKSPEAVKNLMPKGRGLELMKSVYDVLDIMRREEDALLKRRIAAYESVTRYMLLSTLSLVGMLFAVMAGSLFATGREFKRRLLSEQALMEMAGFQTAVLDASYYAIIVCDTNGTIRLVNPAAEKMLGHTAQDLIGKHDPGLFHLPAEVSARARELSEQYGVEINPGFQVFTYVPLHQGSEEREWTYVTKEGRHVPVQMSVTVLYDVHGRVSGFMGVANDITERRQIEKMKNEFISTVSHELRTPLTSIRGSLALVAGNIGGKLPDKAAHLIAIAHKNTERLVRLINNILDIEKIESGHIVFERKPIQIAALLDQALHEGEGLTAEHKLTISVESDCDDAVVTGDMDRLVQVLMNLLSNAAKFSPAQGHITLKAQRTPDGLIEVSVKDQGAGIPDDFRPRIFGKFAQADSQDTRQKGGSGLGLSISKAIVESMDGTIDFTSRPGETIFIIRLHESVQTAKPIPQTKGLSRPKILICEDDPDISSLLEMLLGREGYFCSVAHSAQQARDLLARETFAAMTLDMGLPDANGMELIRELRGQERTRELPIIVISAQNENRQGLEAAAIGIVDWVMKPINQDRLRSALHSLSIKPAERPAVLHIEDDHDITQFLASAMDDIDIVAAPTLAIAREKLKQKRYDLAVLDIHMPDGNGLDLLPELSAKNIPVVILSVHETGRDIQEYVCGSLVKTVVSEKKIIETIKTFIRGN